MNGFCNSRIHDGRSNKCPLHKGQQGCYAMTITKVKKTSTCSIGLLKVCTKVLSLLIWQNLVVKSRIDAPHYAGSTKVVPEGWALVVSRLTLLL